MSFYRDTVVQEFLALWYQGTWGQRNVGSCWKALITVESEHLGPFRCRRAGRFPTHQGKVRRHLLFRPWCSQSPKCLLLFRSDYWVKVRVHDTIESPHSLSVLIRLYCWGLLQSQNHRFSSCHSYCMKVRLLERIKKLLTVLSVNFRVWCLCGSHCYDDNTR